MASVNLRALPAACEGVAKTCFRCGGGFQDFSDPALARVCAECKKPKEKPPRYSPALHGKELTVREKQIADLVAAGKPNKVIAHELHLGEGTIKAFVSIVLAKTGQPNRTALAVWRVLTAWNASVMH